MQKLNFPNPQFIRKNWKDLNGKWDFRIDEKGEGKKRKQFLEDDFYTDEIMVPYVYNTVKSGLNIQGNYEHLWYRRHFSLNVQEGKRYLLHFGAVDYLAEIWINGHYVSKHQGGHVPFQVDISDYVQEENILIVAVEDTNSCRQPIGKQSWKDHNFLCWYTRTAGIWQQVWLEETGSVYLEDLRLTPQIDDASLHIDAFLSDEIAHADLKVEVSFKGKKITSGMVQFKDQRAQMTLDVSDTSPNFRLHFWHPNDPNLYDLRLEVMKDGLIEDQVETYFGMRDVEAVGSKIYLNNQEFYQKLILDQGYFKDGGLTATAQELYDDVYKMKEMGFNGVRKHQKIEDHRFMYLCDVMGLVMWAEFPSPFEYSHISNENVVRELYPFVQKHYNHPSVIAYTVMNESWGINEVYRHRNEQYFVDALYYLTKSLDTTRLVVGNDGWEHTSTDILTVHDYNDDPKTFEESYRDMEKVVNGSPSQTSSRHLYAKGYHYQGQPFMISEYGGIAYEEKKDDIASWGYGQRLENKDEVLKRIEDLTKIIMDNDEIVGFCYTQLTDVEQEVNGLLDENHQYKFDPKEIRRIMSYKHNRGFEFI